MTVPKIALWLSIVCLTLPPLQPCAESAQGLECRHRAASASSVLLGSQVDGNFVTICLSHRQVIQPSNPPIPVGDRSNRKPSAKTQKLASVRAHSKSHGVLRGADGTFSPVIAQPRVSPSATKPGVPVSLTSTQPERFGFDHLLGRQISVRFTPISQRWHLSDGATSASGSRAWRWHHSFLKSGRYLATLHVTYRVRFRLGLGAWQTEPDTITLPANPLEVWVGKDRQLVVVLVKNR